jgi:hypothetical protein
MNNMNSDSKSNSEQDQKTFDPLGIFNYNLQVDSLLNNQLAKDLINGTSPSLDNSKISFSECNQDSMSQDQ